MYHVPVLVNESIELLLHNKGKTSSRIYIDGTLGGGGYTELILNRTDKITRVLAIDRDMNAIEHCKKELSDFAERIIYHQGNFADIKSIIEDSGNKKISGLIFDLGISSYQLESEEGFSYQRDTGLDMRSDTNVRKTAKEVLNKYPEKQLFRIFKEFGELRYFKQITRSILEFRRTRPFKTTFDLVDAVREKIPARYLNKDLSKIFQALRIEVNEELENLKKLLDDVVEFLESGARIVVVSYHSLEDRIVKNFFRFTEELAIITKKPLTPSLIEIESNSRARSAKLRAAERI